MGARGLKGNLIGFVQVSVIALHGSRVGREVASLGGKTVVQVLACFNAVGIRVVGACVCVAFIYVRTLVVVCLYAFV